MRVLVTGGAGYIGSHICLEMLLLGHEVIVVDNMSNSLTDNLKAVEKYTKGKIRFYAADIRNDILMDSIFKANSIEAVVHLAAKKSIQESVSFPIDYYDNNVIGIIRLLEIMKKYECTNMIFSSSASVYGDSGIENITEDFPTGNCINAYAKSKLIGEEILKDLFLSNSKWSITVFRYFNPIGAHCSGVIGEELNEKSCNLMSCIIKVASGQTDKLKIFGNDYPTSDGTGVRDYIHVSDLARAHLIALEKYSGKSGFHIYNLGTGRGYSVLELIHTFEKVTGNFIPYTTEERRAGDLPCCYCSAAKAKKELGWEAKYNLEDMCKTAWNWYLHKSSKI